MGTLPSFAEFEAAERAQGCSELEEHTHPFRARALVVDP